jgi:erythromycin esterase-like protein
MPRGATFAGLLAALAIALAGCGGTSNRPTPQFAAIANAICVNADREVEALPAVRRSLGSLAAAARREIPIVRTELTQLSALAAPPGQAARFAAALATTRRQVSLVAGLVAAVRSANGSRVVTLALASHEADKRAKTEMRALGLGACARAAKPRG